MVAPCCEFLNREPINRMNGAYQFDLMIEGAPNKRKQSQESEYAPLTLVLT